jgi:XrtN system VIT domain protein
MKTSIFKDVTFLIGIGLIILSLVIFLIPETPLFGKSFERTFGIFMMNYFISIIFLVIAWVREIHKFRWSAFHQKMEYGFLHLILCLISAFSLNREIPVFEKSTTWLQIALMLQSIILIVLGMRRQLPAWTQTLLFGLLGIVFMLFLYYSIYLIPLYPLALVAFPALGISFHALVPLWFVLVILFYLLRKDNRTRAHLVSFGVGVLFPVVIVLFFVTQWNHVSRVITKASDQSLMNEKNDLPEWVVIAQHLPKNSITEKILKTELVYSTASENSGWQFLDMPTKSFEEVKKHDPLIMIATFFMGKPHITDDNKIKILEAMYDSRHQAQERLWSGDDLQTSHVLTNVRIFPSLHIGYTEKIIAVRNTLAKNRWLQEQEAIYTFHLPEGGIVTSLSLWINGVEQKAELTSKQKADSAYKTVVGVERHDPSLVRWQEGNTVSVRVFPCTPNEERRFKIGFTAPLREENHKLFYDNIWFDGPSAENAKESIQLKLMDDVKEMNLPSGFALSNGGVYAYEGSYKSDWNLTMLEPAMAQNSFCFDGKSYHVSKYLKTYHDFDPQHIYLDINSAWTKDEFLEILKMTQAKSVYVYQNKMIKINGQNSDFLFQQLQKINFSIFPVNEIKQPENSLLISKGTTASPNLADLSNSEFSLKLQAYLSLKPALNFFNLGYELSPYLKTIKELRVFQYDFGELSDLAKLLKEKKFTTDQEDQQNVVIHEAGIKITEATDSTLSNAPDHLMRLFAYGNVMYRTGVNYLKKDFYDEQIVDEAYKAYVVSPATSLVVLESKQDYKRFDIKDDGTSLKNASMKSSGAVPEPHEWLLVLVIVGVLVYIKVKR